ncbi:MAG: hypothetical protein ACR2PR_01360 [Pseudohongiellaceae bacterium]
MVKQMRGSEKTGKGKTSGGTSNAAIHTDSGVLEQRRRQKKEAEIRSRLKEFAREFAQARRERDEALGIVRSAVHDGTR